MDKVKIGTNLFSLFSITWVLYSVRNEDYDIRYVVGAFLFIVFKSLTISAFDYQQSRNIVRHFAPMTVLLWTSYMLLQEFDGIVNPFGLFGIGNNQLMTFIFMIEFEIYKMLSESFYFINKKTLRSSIITLFNLFLLNIIWFDFTAQSYFPNLNKIGLILLYLSIIVQSFVKGNIPIMLYLASLAVFAVEFLSDGSSSDPIIKDAFWVTVGICLYNMIREYQIAQFIASIAIGFVMIVLIPFESSPTLAFVIGGCIVITIFCFVLFRAGVLMPILIWGSEISFSLFVLNIFLFDSTNDLKETFLDFPIYSLALALTSGLFNEQKKKCFYSPTASWLKITIQTMLILTYQIYPEIGVLMVGTILYLAMKETAIYFHKSIHRNVWIADLIISLCFGNAIFFKLRTINDYFDYWSVSILLPLLAAIQWKNVTKWRESNKLDRSEIIGDNINEVLIKGREITLYIVTITGEAFDIQISEDVTVWDMKKELPEAFRKDKELILMVDDLVLKDDVPIRNYNLKNGTNVTMIKTEKFRNYTGVW